MGGILSRPGCELKWNEIGDERENDANARKSNQDSDVSMVANPDPNRYMYISVWTCVGRQAEREGERWRLVVIKQSDDSGQRATASMYM